MLHACSKVQELLKKKETDEGAYYLSLMEYGKQYCREWKRVGTVHRPFHRLFARGGHGSLGGPLLVAMGLIRSTYI